MSVMLICSYYIENIHDKYYDEKDIIDSGI